MKLYYMPGACPLVTQIALEWMGQPYELQRVDATSMKTPEFLALNPVGSVPVLIDGDLTMTQSVAILEYLDERYPGSGLHGSTLEERMEVRRWLSFCNADLHRTFSLIFGVQGYSSDADIQKLIVDKTVERLQFLFGIADKQLEGKQWLANQRSYADAYLYVLLTWTKFKNVELPGMTNLDAFFERMTTEPAVQAAHKRQEQDA